MEERHIVVNNYNTKISYYKVRLNALDKLKEDCVYLVLSGVTYKGMLAENIFYSVKNNLDTKLEHIIGIVHNTDGPAVEFPNGIKNYYSYGIRFDSKEEWFAALTPEEKYNYIWNL